MNVNAFSPSFIWICLTSVSTFVSCCSQALWDWSAFSRPAVTLHLSHVHLLFVCESSHSVQVSQTSCFSLFSGYSLWLFAASLGIWRLKLEPHILVLISALPSVTVGHPSLLVRLGLAVILMSSFCGEVHVELLLCCCCCPQKVFFLHFSVCQTLIHHPQMH